MSGEVTWRILAYLLLAVGFLYFFFVPSLLFEVNLVRNPDEMTIAVSGLGAIASCGFSGWSPGVISLRDAVLRRGVFPSIQSSWHQRRLTSLSTDIEDNG